MPSLLSWVRCSDPKVKHMFRTPLLMKYVKCSLAITLAASLLLASYDGRALGFLMPIGKTTINKSLPWRMPGSRSSSKQPTSTYTGYGPEVIEEQRSCRVARRRSLLMGVESTPQGGGEGGSSSNSSGGDTGSGGNGGLQSGESEAIEDGGGGGEPESLASLVESTFVLAASSNSYTEGLKSFIQVVKEAYERGYTVPALTMEVSFVPTKTAGRDLFPDEVELRSIWIALVYLTLEQASWPQKVPRAHEISAAFMDRFAVFVGNVMTAAAKGHTLQTLKLEEVMRRGAEPRTPMESAVLSQSMRIVFSTLALMKEGWTG